MNQKKAWLYLLPSLVLLGAFLVYPLIDVFIYSLAPGIASAVAPSDEVIALRETPCTADPSPCAAANPPCTI